MIKIYGIRNLVTSNVYVGCTAAKLNKRMREHKCLLNANQHSSKLFQKEWLEYGQDKFEMITFEELPDNASVVDKRVAELYWMQKYQDKLYNAYQNSFAPTEEARIKGVESRANQLRGSTQTPESNLKRRLAQVGIPKGHGAKISATKQLKKAMLNDEIVCSNAKK
jgi:group I intron endonuclease